MLYNQNPQYQSPYVYLQAAGSDGSDGSAQGIHLRWDFRRILRDKHIAKGNLAQSPPYDTNQWFNRQDDYVKVYRALASYELMYWNTSQQPSQILETGSLRMWQYTVQGTVQQDRTVWLRFNNVEEYEQVKASLGTPPSADPSAFIHAYKSVMELGVRDHLIFEANVGEVNFQDASSNLKIEGISLPDQMDQAGAYISCRHQFDSEDYPMMVKGENMTHLRLQLEGTTLYSVGFAIYDDVIETLDQSASWNLIGDFSLSMDDNEAMSRLEDPGNYEIHQNWPKYQESDPGSGEFTVNVANYQDRWDRASGIKEGVHQYLFFSKNSPEAIEYVLDEDEVASSELSYLNLLRFASIDYHVARMLGLGHIDAEPNAHGQQQRFLYLMEYVTEAELEPGTTALERTHYYMSLPTSKMDFCLPPAPVLNPVDYGLFVDNGTPNPTQLSDENGYVPANNGSFDYVRYINLRKDPFQYEHPMEPFFATNTEFCLGQESMPVQFGLMYKEISEAIFRRPGILFDAEYQDPAGTPEVIAIPEHGDLYRPIYAHRETEEGEHAYALYSINWFSRLSSNSNLVQTDRTSFPIRNTLLPPSQFAVQLIQEEDPLIFTSQQEQDHLAQLPGPDKTMVRASFDWNFIQNIEYQFGDTVEIFFKESAPLMVQGKITSLDNTDSAVDTVVVETGPLHITSVVPNQVLQPNISSGDSTRFIGSMMVIDQTPFEVLEVRSFGNNPSFLLRKIQQRQVSEPNQDGAIFITETFEGPQLNAIFLLNENIANPTNWDAQLSKTVGIEQFAPAYTETITDHNGNPKVVHPGGIFASATITEYPEVYAPDDPVVLQDPDNPPFAGDPIPNSHSGIYSVLFPTTTLDAHPDPEVDWFKGMVRISEDASLFPPETDASYRPPVQKLLKVHSIEQSSPLELIVMDPEFDPTSNQTNPQSEYMPIQTGANVDVNFHPSYRLYLYEDSQNGNRFNEQGMLPSTGAGQKITYMAARSKDSNTGLVSQLTQPIPLLAMELQVPVAPEGPVGPTFATRPNFYGKSTYTFDVKVDTTAGRKPYALLFMRAEQRKILDTLYSPATVSQIESDLEGLSEEDAAFFNNRWLDLVNGEYDPATNQFKEYIPNGYRFPLPDNESYVIPSYDPAIQIQPFDGQNDFSAPNFAQITKDAILGAFVSLTEQPVLYKYVKNGRKTSSEAPKFRDSNGDLIVPGNLIDFNQFDPFPMVVKYVDGQDTKLRFTDYTIDGAASTFYFYLAVELSNRQEFSDVSPVAGPVQLVNTMPAEAPEIRQIVSQAANPILRISSAVKLKVNEYIESENIREFHLFRAMNPVDAMSIRTMSFVKKFAVGEQIVDAFEDMDIPPYGDPLFYRVVAMRGIINENGEEELVPSKASKLALSSVIDNGNPLAPALSINSGTITPIEATQVMLQWEKTVHNGQYHIYKMNAAGNWTKIHTIKSNANSLTVQLVDTNWADTVLPKQNDEGRTIYHHFKVVAENASGLLSLNDHISSI